MKPRKPIPTDLIWGADEIDGLGNPTLGIDAATIGSRNLLRALARYHFERAATPRAKNHWKALAR